MTVQLKSAPLIVLLVLLILVLLWPDMDLELERKPAGQPHKPNKPPYKPGPAPHKPEAPRNPPPWNRPGAPKPQRPPQAVPKADKVVEDTDDGPIDLTDDVDVIINAMNRRAFCAAQKAYDAVKAQQRAWNEAHPIQPLTALFNADK